MLTRRQSHAIEIEDLTAKLASAQAEIGRLRTERDALAGKLGELLEAARLAEASTWREMASIKEEMDRIRAFARTENAKELDHVCGERDAAIAKLAAASEEMKKITAAAHAEHALLETSRIENESLRCALKNATEESNRLQAALASRDVVRADLQISALTIERDQAVSRNTALCAALNARGEDVRRITAERDEAVAARKVAEEKAADLHDRHDRALQAVQNFGAANIPMLTEIKSNFDRLKTLEQQLTHERDTAIAAHQACGAKIAELQRTVDSCVEETATWRGTADKLLKENATLSEIVVDCRRTHGSQQWAVSQEAEQTIAALKGQLYDCQGELERVRSGSCITEPFREDLSHMKPQELGTAVTYATYLVNYLAIGNAPLACEVTHELRTRVGEAIKPALLSVIELVRMYIKQYADSYQILCTLSDTLRSYANQEFWGLIHVLLFSALRATVTVMVHYPRVTENLP